MRQVGAEYAEAFAEYAREAGAVFCQAYHQPAIAAGAGTPALEILNDEPSIETVVVAVGGGGPLAGVLAGLNGRASVVAVEPRSIETLNSALKQGWPVDVDVSGIAAEYGRATALAALLAGACVPQPGERITVVVGGANTDPATLSTGPTASRPSEAAETRCDAAHIDAE